MRKYIFAVCLITVLFAGTVSAADTPVVTYDGSKGEFIFRPPENGGFFSSLQDIMPGDRKTAEVQVNMKNISAPARLYLRAEPADGSADALKPLIFTVSRDGATVSEPGSLSRNVLLEAFACDGSAVYDIAVTVPADAGNELAHKTCSLRWIFTVQEEGGELRTDEMTVPETGDRYVIFLLYAGIAVMLAAGTGILVLAARGPQNSR